MGYFRRTRSGRSISLDPVEAAVLSQVIAEMAQVIAPAPEASTGQQWAAELGLAGLGDLDPAAGDPVPPTDPIRARMFPSAYADDDDAAREFRRFTENDLRATKAANAEAMMRSLPEQGGTVVLDEAGCSAWLGALNDARLALGTALEVDESTEQELAQLEANDPRARRLIVYHWLGELQDSLLRTLMSD